jgi:hypothetical protein
MNPVPTVDDLLQATHIGNGFHHWHVEGGVIQLTKDQLTIALELRLIHGRLACNGRS